ncbi:phosphoenolpyruvate-protein phosphotransferase [Paenibacillus baekrokdamisoli]|uniref:Phosphoenolpyruvate-protein phosphotransferase n=1 Tax=Paenibacillus baekrokdamisoli TaxID=1712516 RepID=A0A3G9JPX5_9BACL|nr:phosphoenolpyruvate--protein phosphotransferase [Paenibacillus baekrokdamisoli]MBB3069532.1 phosphotransferase system enzyme I (PtsI) [Paenibacillus baekrokdamisoli]BBH24894.1 phosphoenolpyruvate-protein phosphotransferase [Paenibacillus baekrokdamisoli]
MIVFNGVAASPGIAIGRAWRLETEESHKGPASIVSSAVAEQTSRLQAAVLSSVEEVRKLRDELTERGRGDEAEIFDGHLLLLEDEELIGRAEEAIKNKLIPAELAIAATRDEVAAVMESLEDEYLRERASDIRDVCGRVIGKLTGRTEMPTEAGDEPVIILAPELTPSHTAQLKPDIVAGFVTLQGGKTSHTAIIARSLGIPAIVGMGDQLQAVRGGQYLIVDGSQGQLHVDPDAETIAHFRALQRANLAKLEQLRKLTSADSVSADGFQVELVANIGSPEDAAAAKNNGAEGIGLFRTEFLYMGRDTLPSEEEQFQAYRKVVKAFGPDAPIIIRTMDIGGDKELPILQLPQEDNPFLGYRAIRICLDRPELFKTQLRAILRASAFGNVKIMFPMIAALSEWRAAKAVLDQCKEELQRERIAFNPELEVGIMIEVPAAAMLADRFAKEVDFFSIGTNDLTQYTLAADRMNEKLAHLNDPLQPAVLYLIEKVIRAAQKAGKWTGMCGEMAGSPHAVPILLGLGLKEFSMSGGSIFQTRALISTLSQSAMAELASKALELEGPDEIRSFVEAQVPEILAL